MSDDKNNTIYERIKTIYYSLIKYDYDQQIILKFLSKYSRKENCQVLDVGCGYGKKMRAIATAGYQVLGVDVNPTIVEANKKQGLNCITVADFSQTTDKFDVILMSHIIEHFHPEVLKDFMDDYLDRLKVGGYLIIATPLLTEYFYEDFDHVKPYLPIGILMVFGKAATQVQYYSRNKLALKDLQFRIRHYRFTLVRAQSIRTWATKFYQIAEFICVLLYFISFGLLGRKDGWVGIFQKI